MDDPEELEGIDGPDDEVVVGVLAVVEVEAAEELLGKEERDDLLDVRPLRMMAGVYEHLCLRPEAAADERGCAPVREVGAVEGRLEELVLDEQPHALRKCRVDLLETVDEARMSLAKIVLAGVVRPVGQPEADDGRVEPGRDLDAFAAVLDRLARTPASGWQMLPRRYASSPNRFGLIAPTRTPRSAAKRPRSP